MTNFMKLAAAAMLFIAAQNANAISLRFKFKTFSSGPDIYACNAGLRHEASAHKVCYFEDTKTACTPQECNGTVCNTRCVCTNDNGGEYLMDYMKGSYSTWNQSKVEWNQTWTSTTAQAGQGAYNTLVPHADAFKNRIKELSFNLGSELYGAEYFVDICYRGPQIEYFEDGVTANWSLQAQATATDFIANAVNGGDNTQDGLTMNPTGIKYTTLAGLKVQAITVCDLQGMGQIQKSRNNAGYYNTLDNEASFSNWNSPMQASGDFYTKSNQVQINSVANLINSTIDNSTKAPRFCRIRYIFSETDGAAGSQVLSKNLRKWQRHGAELCTYTKIEESVEQ
ncbi:protease [Bdellovibrio bacteriovorus]|uniref:Protease n=1 Tax=Bdellovibrio bacteriovorus TaxID=959 RepID=A0A162FUP0_BDEBC|nr:hypothetical protein [Bdellovibrio bacteriovorus]KYG62330.1 protease [Bdellovibrio bacteriovorus]